MALKIESFWPNYVECIFACLQECMRVISCNVAFRFHSVNSLEVYPSQSDRKEMKLLLILSTCDRIYFRFFSGTGKFLCKNIIHLY